MCPDAALPHPRTVGPSHSAAPCSEGCIWWESTPQPPHTKDSHTYRARTHLKPPSPHSDGAFPHLSNQVLREELLRIPVSQTLNLDLGLQQQTSSAQAVPPAPQLTVPEADSVKPVLTPYVMTNSAQGVSEQRSTLRDVGQRLQPGPTDLPSGKNGLHGAGVGGRFSRPAPG